MAKLCPLRKLIFHYNNGEDVESFMPCMEDECMWYRRYTNKENEPGICSMAVVNF